VNVLEKPQEREEQLQDFARRGGSREDAGFDAWGLILNMKPSKTTILKRYPLWKIAIFNGKTHYKWPFSIAMLVYQRVNQNINQL